MVNTPNNDYVLRLVTSINGTKQAANNYYNLRSKPLLIQYGFQVSTVDPCFFWKWVNDKHLCCILVWTDDYRIFCDRESDLAYYTKMFTDNRQCTVQPGGEEYLCSKPEYLLMLWYILVYANFPICILSTYMIVAISILVYRNTGSMSLYMVYVYSVHI